MERPTNAPVNATANSIEILEAIVDLEGATITELDEYLSFSKSTIHNHLQTLEVLEFVVKDGWTYRISHRFLEFGAHARQQNPLFEYGQSETNRLANVTGCVAVLAVLERDRAICTYSVAPAQEGRNLVQAGETFPLHCTAAGKALLSTFDDDTVRKILERTGHPRYTANTSTSMDEILTELQSVRSKGLAFDRQEWRDDVRSIGTAITGTDETLLGAIAILSDAQSMTGKRFQQDNPGLVISSANAIQNTIQ